jgi:hypothetical protein
MDFIKSWFIDGANKTGCRFIVVDSYNDAGPLKYYSENNFVPLFSSDDQEKEYTGIPLEAILPTRLMYFDLIVLKRADDNSNISTSEKAWYIIVWDFIKKMFT